VLALALPTLSMLPTLPTLSADLHAAAGGPA
jgi:hypothetical protein